MRCEGMKFCTVCVPCAMTLVSDTLAGENPAIPINLLFF